MSCPAPRLRKEVGKNALALVSLLIRPAEVFARRNIVTPYQDVWRRTGRWSGGCKISTCSPAREAVPGGFSAIETTRLTITALRGPTPGGRRPSGTWLLGDFYSAKMPVRSTTERYLGRKQNLEEPRERPLRLSFRFQNSRIVISLFSPVEIGVVKDRHVYQNRSCDLAGLWQRSHGFENLV